MRIVLTRGEEGAPDSSNFRPLVISDFWKTSIFTDLADCRLDEIHGRNPAIALRVRVSSRVMRGEPA